MFSRLPIEKLDGQAVGLTKESDTSVNLLKILLRKFYNHHNSFTRTTNSTINALEEFSAILLIGDSALKASLSEVKDIYVYDLGDLWFRHTGLPFVFALWIIREEAIRKEKNKVIALHTALCDAKNCAYSSFENLADNYIKEWIGKKELIDYWETISYDLTPLHLDGLRLFYRYSAELGLIEGEPQIRLFP